MPAVVTYSARSAVASFKADPQIWSQFKEECWKRGAEICCVMEALMLAWMEGQRAEATVVKPVTVHVHLQHVVERLRRGGPGPEPWEVARSQNWPPNCEYADKFLQGPKEVGCTSQKEWIPLEKCWRCYLAKNY